MAKAAARKAAGGRDATHKDRVGTLETIGRGGIYVLFGAVALVLEAGLLAWFVAASSGGERIAAGVLMVIVLLAVLGAGLVVERGRQGLALAALPAETRAAVARLDTPGVSAAEVRAAADPAASPAGMRGPEPMGAPDGSYVIGPPPAGWAVSLRSPEEALAHQFGVTDATGLPRVNMGKILTFTFGEQLAWTPQPDRMRIAGRMFPILLPFPLQRQVRIFTFPRRQMPLFIERTFYHNMVLALSSMIQGPSLLSLTPGTLPLTNRDVLVAEFLATLEHVRLGAREVPLLREETRLIGVNGDLFDYFISIYNVRVGDDDRTAEAMAAGVEALLGSFRPLLAADTEAARKTATVRADQDYGEFIENNGAAIFRANFGVAVQRLKEGGYDTPEQLAGAMALLRPFRTFAGMLRSADTDIPDLWAAMDDAEHGDTSRLRMLLHQQLDQAPPPEGDAAPVLAPPVA
jgi:hypothetical protein